MAIKVGEATIAGRLNDAKVAATAAAKAYYDAVRELREFHDASKSLIEDGALRKRRETLIEKRDEAYRVLEERNLIWDWMRAESNKHGTDNGQPRLKD